MDEGKLDSWFKERWLKVMVGITPGLWMSKIVDNPKMELAQWASGKDSILRSDWWFNLVPYP